MKILVLGGYGNFGARISRALCADPAIQLLIGGRSAHAAQAFAQALGGSEANKATGIAIDHTAPDFAQRLRALGVELLIHTAGPFQAQGYEVALAAAAAGAHYIDLADGRRFVCDFAAATNAAFTQAGTTAVTGASTVPALSSAVINALCAGWQAIHAIDICIAPAQTAPRGQATLAAVLSYCGAPISVWLDGRWQNRLGWAQHTWERFARLRPRRGALCDIPDLELFPTHYRVRERVMFRAALEVGWAQRAFAVLAQLRQWGLLRHPERLASFLNRTAPLLDFLGSPLGGMVVRVQGQDAKGQAAQRAWHIAADNDHGPEIPCMATILLARKLAHGQPLPVGAMTSMDLLTLDEFAPEFDRWRMVRDYE
jgi:saccharopine dehydrogenase-like NADP-dependent oxidoreductase